LNDRLLWPIRMRTDEVERIEPSRFGRCGHCRMAMDCTERAGFLVRRLPIIPRWAGVRRVAGRMADRKRTRRIRGCGHEAGGADARRRKLHIKRKDRKTDRETMTQRRGSRCT
jgi:hypothetical protein